MRRLRCFESFFTLQVFEAQMEFLSDEVMGARLIVEISGVKITFYISKLYIKGTVCTRSSVL